MNCSLEYIDLVNIEEEVTFEDSIVFLPKLVSCKKINCPNATVIIAPLLKNGDFSAESATEVNLPSHVEGDVYAQNAKIINL